jgi:hypothetical protein
MAQSLLAIQSYRQQYGVYWLVDKLLCKN